MYQFVYSYKFIRVFFFFFCYTTIFLIIDFNRKLRNNLHVFISSPARIVCVWCQKLYKKKNELYVTIEFFFSNIIPWDSNK